MKRCHYFLLAAILSFTVCGCSPEKKEKTNVDTRPIVNFTDVNDKAKLQITTDAVRFNRANIYLNSHGGIAYINADIWVLEEQKNHTNYYGDGRLSCGDITENIADFEATADSVEYHKIQTTELATEYADSPDWVSLREFTALMDRVDLKSFINHHKAGEPSYYDVQFYPLEPVYRMIADKGSNTKYYAYSGGRISAAERPRDIETGLSGIRADQVLLVIIPYYGAETVSSGVDTAGIGQNGKTFHANNLMVLVIDREETGLSE